MKLNEQLWESNKLITCAAPHVGSHHLEGEVSHLDHMLLPASHSAKVVIGWEPTGAISQTEMQLVVTFRPFSPLTNEWATRKPQKPRGQVKCNNTHPPPSRNLLSQSTLNYYGTYQQETAAFSMSLDGMRATRHTACYRQLVLWIFIKKQIPLHVAEHGDITT